MQNIKPQDFKCITDWPLTSPRLTCGHGKLHVFVPYLARMAMGIEDAIIPLEGIAMNDIARLIEKLKLIEALHAGAYQDMCRWR